MISSWSERTINHIRTEKGLIERLQWGILGNELRLDPAILQEITTCVFCHENFFSSN